MECMVVPPVTKNSNFSLACLNNHKNIFSLIKYIHDYCVVIKPVTDNYVSRLLQTIVNTTNVA